MENRFISNFLWYTFYFILSYELLQDRSVFSYEVYNIILIFMLLGVMFIFFSINKKYIQTPNIAYKLLGYYGVMSLLCYICSFIYNIITK